MDAHAAEYAAAIDGMNDTYGPTITPPMLVSIGSRRIPVWNHNATVAWTDANRRHCVGIVVDIRYPGDDREADQRIYVIRYRDPVSRQVRHIELTHDSLIEW